MRYGISKRAKPTIWEVDGAKRSDPHITHMLFRTSSTDVVDKLCISCLLLRCNDVAWAFLGLYVGGFLPTMKIQLSQLP